MAVVGLVEALGDGAVGQGDRGALVAGAVQGEELGQGGVSDGQNPLEDGVFGLMGRSALVGSLVDGVSRSDPSWDRSQS